MPLDPRLEAIRQFPQPDRTIPVAERRATAAATAAMQAAVMTIPEPLADERDEVIDAGDHQIPVRIYRPSDGRLPCILFIHGGGWWGGTIEQSDPTCRRRASAIGCVVVSVDYRLAPEYRYPAGLDDCWAALAWVFDRAEELDIDPDRIAVEGQSAGGNLAAATTLLVRDRGGPGLVAQVLEVPVTDATMSQPSVQEFAEGYGFGKADLAECIELYLGDHDRTDPLASPLHGELRDLPPALIITAECDPLRDEGEAYAARLADAGSPVEVRRMAGQVHGSAELDRIVPDAAQTVSSTIVDFLRTAFATEPVVTS